MTARIIEVSDVDYYADNVGLDVPTLSYSVAKTILMDSPERARLEHPKLGAKRREPSTAMDLGNVIDSLLLCNGQGLCVIDAADYRNKDAQADRDAAREKREIPVLLKIYEKCKLAVAAYKAKIEALGISLDGKSQVTILWTEETSLGPVWCKGKLDHLRLNYNQILDLKSTAGRASTAQVAKNIFERGYDIQQAAYTSAVERVYPRLIGRTEFLWITVEVDEPYPVSVVRPDGALKELGRRRWRRSCEVWARCLKENSWPSYSSRIETVSAPPWALKEEMIPLD